MLAARLARAVTTTALALVLAAPLVASGGAPAEAAAAGAWQTRSQLVWDAGAGRLVRKQYVAWDPAPDLGLEFAWDGEATRDGLIDGEGRLVWRRKGAPAYDVNAVYSDYRGEVRNGRPDGAGRLRLSTGLVYEGGWRDGAMAGEGLIRFVNGEAFEGGFAAGSPDGVGRLTTPNGRVWRSVWRDGAEVERAPVGQGQQFAEAGSVDVDVYLDSRLNDQFRSGQDEDGFERYSYGVDDATGVLEIRLASDEIMNLWKGDAPITATLRQGISDYFEDTSQFGPVFVVVNIANEENQTAEVTGAYLDIAESMSDLQPYIDAYGPADGCNARLVTDFWLYNSGWGPVENARLTYAFGTEKEPGKSVFVAEIGSFEDNATPSITDSLTALGLDVERLQTADFQCSSEDAVPDLPRRLAELGSPRRPRRRDLHRRPLAASHPALGHPRIHLDRRQGRHQPAEVTGRRRLPGARCRLRSGMRGRRPGRARLPDGEAAARRDQCPHPDQLPRHHRAARGEALRPQLRRRQVVAPPVPLRRRARRRPHDRLAGHRPALLHPAHAGVQLSRRHGLPGAAPALRQRISSARA